MILQMLSILVLSVVLAWGSWQLIFKPLTAEYDSKMSHQEGENAVSSELDELQAEIELDIKKDKETVKRQETTVS